MPALMFLFRKVFTDRYLWLKVGLSAYTMLWTWRKNKHIKTYRIYPCCNQWLKFELLGMVQKIVHLKTNSTFRAANLVQ